MSEVASKFGFTNDKTGYIDGFAFRSEDVRKLHEEAFETVKHIDIKIAVTKKEHGYGRNIFWLDSEYANSLEPLQKLVLANGGPCAFGGVVNHDKVQIYNDLL